MRVSCLIVTKNRTEFLPWLSWNISKQTRAPDEIVIVDSSACVQHDGDYEERAKHLAWMNIYIAALSPNYKYIIVDPKTHKTGDSRNVALAEATGDIVMWFDDDDWHHPRRIQLMAEAIESERCKLIYVGNTHRLILETMQLINIEETLGDISLPFCAVPTEIAKLHEFPSMYTAEDVHWLQRVSASCRGEILFYQGWDIPTIALIHGKNTWNKPDLREYDFYKQVTDCEFPEYASRDLDQAEWDETLKQLKELRERLGMQGENK